MAGETALFVSSAFPANGSAELIRTVEQGIPLDCLDTLRKWGMTFTEVGEMVIPPRTLKYRRARGERLTTEETERFLRVMRVLELGERVFGSREKLFRWLRSADGLIDNRTSMSLLATESGANRVEGQLWAIAEGFAS